LDAKELRVETALTTYPVVPLPPGFKRRVMAEIVKYETRFHLDFLDFVLPVFLWLFCSISFLTLAWLLRSLDPLWFVHLQIAIRSLQVYLIGFPYWPVVMFSVFGMATIVLSTIIAYFVLTPNRVELR
jgi:hypothetical protein